MLHPSTPTHRNRCFTLIELMIVVAIIAIIAAIAIPNLMRSRMQANETMAVASLKAYAGAQYIYQKSNYAQTNGGMQQAFAPSFANLSGPNAHLTSAGASLDLIATDMAKAVSPSAGFQGYYFLDDTNVTAVMLRYNFGLYSDPCVYDSSGVNSFYISSRGVVYMKDLGSAGSGGSVAVDSTWYVP